MHTAVLLPFYEFCEISQVNLDVDVVNYVRCESRVTWYEIEFE